METEKIFSDFNDELYFFILKKVKNKDVSNDIFQNTFLKIHNNLSQVENKEKVKAWVFQICRNEIATYFKKESDYVGKLELNKDISSQNYQHICCFDKFINELPEIYRQVIELIYISGLKQQDAANKLDISLENVKARIKRAKEILKKKFNECCKYELNNKGKLTGESDCAICQS